MSCPPLDPRDLDHVVKAVAPLWPRLRASRLFVTGGSGFFGAWILETWLAARERNALDTTCMVLTRNAARFRERLPHIATHPAIEVIEGDVRTFAFPTGSFTHAIHAAAEASAALNEERPLEMFDSIVRGTRHVLDFAVRAGVGRFLLTSSGAVYGPQAATVAQVTEDAVTAPVVTDTRSAYGEGKRAAELLCAIRAREHPALQPLLARAFAFVGPHLPLDRHFAIGNFIADALAGRTIEVRGDGTPLRSYLYAADLAIWLWTIFLAGEPLRPYNVGSERAVSIAETARIVADVVDRALPVHIAQPAGGGPPARYVPSTARARAELGLSQSIDLSDAVARTIAWQRR
jgi:nucleoside-diphosphate-sugar epimerase